MKAQRSKSNTYTIGLSNTTHAFSLTRRKNQKNINLRIGHDGRLSVSAPPHVTLSRIREVMRKKEPWISKHLLIIQRQRESIDPTKTILLNGNPAHIVRQKAEKRGSVIYNESEGKLTVKTLTPDDEAYFRLVGEWLQRYGRKELLARVEQTAHTLNIPYKRVFVRNQKTRWGSSSGKGNISLNWRIIMAPLFVQDYLIIHELVHQRHHHHQKSFWEAVENHYPGWREADGWLKENRLLLALFR